MWVYICRVARMEATGDNVALSVYVQYNRYEHSRVEGQVRVARILALANQKGGVGKTTSTVNLSAYLAARGFRTLLIDIDPQGNATSSLGVDKAACSYAIYDALLDGTPLPEVIVPSGQERLALVPSTSVLLGSETEAALTSVDQREHRLVDALRSLPDDAYDLVLIDCPPSLGLLTLNALVAAEGVIIPIQCEFLALEGLVQLSNNIQLVKRTFNAQLDILGVLLTMYDARTRLSAQVAEEVRRFFPNRLFASTIPRGIHLAEAPSYGQSILAYDPASRGALAYAAAADETIVRLGLAAPLLPAPVAAPSSEAGVTTEGGLVSRVASRLARPFRGGISVAD
ncbi:MAG: Chromosome (plasmid) partitioning protein ParA [uncultured Thermomicrobiales bacterium]|uniref:Chromosome (Plasmid) partitioning protein ParA n=1 Tax=uncultured Thermomicrobiales bacterium TaxID=1645740 RepID=A0A6J4VZN9_9BACT|nr:MAG: Chromosome (plasmid) partitioning protein ParA [uncultured Thermomicrobiales bacterium]